MLSQNITDKERTPICLENKMRTLLHAYKTALDNNRKTGSYNFSYMEIMNKIFADSSTIHKPHTMQIGFGHVEIPEESFSPSSPLNLSEATQSPPLSPSSAVDWPLPSSSSGVQISLTSLSTSPSSAQAKTRRRTARGRYFDEKLKIKKLAVEQKAKQREQALSDLKALLKKKWENETTLEQKKLTLLESILNSQN
ncbi:uncharacterized protein LOC119672834 [Teleopsis dalmanni]|uniref:uncharacterized protein LOC119672834 n=1 Tax=Teleopsis dalmanni TaxID=139649 RepID=UPI0018CD8938|nr:uncharacterized protein LOC119672834 [Teleopsis dalmanni]